MTNELFEGAIINAGKPNEKRFPFVRVTESSRPRIVKKLTRPNYRADFINWILNWGGKRDKYLKLHPTTSYQEEVNLYLQANPKETYNTSMAQYKDLIAHDLVYFSLYESQRAWKRNRKYMFEKNFLWKIFRIPPKELWCRNILTRESDPIKKKFENYLKETTKESDEQSSS